MSVSFSGNYFKQSKVVHPNKKSVVNIYIVYKLDEIYFRRNTDYTIQNTLFGAIKISEDGNNSSNSKNSGYGICFHAKSDFTIGNITHGKNVIILGVDNSSSIHANNKKKQYPCFRERFYSRNKWDYNLWRLLYKTNMTELGKKLILSLHYNGNNSYLFCNGVEQLKFAAKNSEIQRNTLCVGNLSSYWTVTKSEKTGLYGSSV